MKIVVLDGYTLNPGDLSWEPFEKLGEVIVHERSTTQSLVLERAADADALIVNKVAIGKETLSELPTLKYIGVTATGFDIIDMKEAHQCGITVTNVPGYSTYSVAQHVFALLLELTNRVGIHAKSTARGEWSQGEDWSYTKRPIVELYGKTLGIIGLGNIGKAVAQIGMAMGMEIIAFGPRPKEVEGVEWVNLVELFQRSDVISLHCPLTDETHHLVDSQLLSLMKPTAYLINTSRGGLIKEQDLALALNEGKISGAGLDVLSSEPPESDNPLLDARKCFVTPHNAWASKEARWRLLSRAAENLRCFVQQEPINVVNPL